VPQALLALVFSLFLIHHCKKSLTSMQWRILNDLKLSVKNTMVTLLGLPRITIAVVPIHKFLPNIMDIPFISGFVSSAIDTAAAEYVAPNSLTLDLQRLISGDDIKKDTDAIGVLVVHIHRAKGVKKSDTTGSSGAILFTIWMMRDNNRTFWLVDPYLTLTYSRLDKPLYSTRIIKGDLNPVFEETAVVLVDVNTIRLREKLSFQLWDSDRMSVVCSMIQICFRHLTEY
jgi:Ca2+-dependent lipid-binding protein